MSKEMQETFFTSSGTLITTESISKKTRAPFKDNAIFTFIHDTLARRHQHHIVARTEFATFLNVSFIEALVSHLAKPTTAPRLHHASAIFIDIRNLLLELTDEAQIKADFAKLKAWLKDKNKTIILAIANAELLNTDEGTISETLTHQIKALIPSDHCRIVLLQSTSNTTPFGDIESAFITTPTIALPTKDNLMVLRMKRDELEEYHHVTIADDLMEETYDLSMRYLSPQHAIEKTVLLLDSCAARASAVEKTQHAEMFKSAVKMPAIFEVLSSWTKIPISHLQLNQFSSSDFVNDTQKRIFGQDAAISLAASELQQAHMTLRTKQGPFAALLLAGPAHSGKKTMAAAITLQLFRQINLLYTVHFAADTTTFDQVKLQRYMQNRFHGLREVIDSTPCAVLLFENIDQAPLATKQALQEIVATGFYHGADGVTFDFRQSLIIMTTTAATEHLHEPSKPEKIFGFGQLITDEQAANFNAMRSTASQLELIDKLRDDLSACLPEALCRQAAILPFYKLQKKAIEQIIQLKISTLCRQLAATRDLKLEYATEVPRFLSAQVAGNNDDNMQPINIEKALKQLYSCIETTLSSKPPRQMTPAKLYLAVSEHHDTLKCEWYLDEIERSA